MPQDAPQPPGGPASGPPRQDLLQYHPREAMALNGDYLGMAQHTDPTAPDEQPKHRRKPRRKDVFKEGFEM